jgi:tripartite-type tricarboxylate transporter receptor subunit TctC
LTACGDPATASSSTAFFTGRTVRIVVGFGAGGGYDVQARVLANYLGRHLPGGPTVVAESMPGAGGLIAANYLARQASRDGLTIGYIGLQAVLSQLIGSPGVQYDARRFIAIGALTSEDVDVCIMTRASGVHLGNWRTRAAPPRIGSTIRGSANHVRSTLMSAALDLPIRLVMGYKGTAEIRLAMESGEVDGTCLGLNTYRTTFEPTHQYAVTFRLGEDPDLRAQGVPAAVAADARGQALLDLTETLRQLDRFFVAPPDTPADRVEAIRSALAATLRDPEFLTAATQARLSIRPASAAEITDKMLAVLTLPADRRALVSQLLAEETR